MILVQIIYIFLNDLYNKLKEVVSNEAMDVIEKRGDSHTSTRFHTESYYHDY